MHGNMNVKDRNLFPLHWEHTGIYDVSCCTRISIEYFLFVADTCRRSQWPRGLGRRSAAARLLILWVQILSRSWVYVC